MKLGKLSLETLEYSTKIQEEREEPYQNDFYVKVVKNEIVGVVRLIFDHDVATIGSLAVLPQYQV